MSDQDHNYPYYTLENCLGSTNDLLNSFYRETDNTNGGFNIRMNLMFDKIHPGQSREINMKECTKMFTFLGRTPYKWHQNKILSKVLQNKLNEFRTKYGDAYYNVLHSQVVHRLGLAFSD